MATLGSLFVPEIQLLDNVGAPLVGGKLFFYAAGTLTPQNTYSDSGLTTPNANPVILDSAGRAVIFLAQSAYKVICKTSADVVLWTIDNVYPPGYIANQIVVAGLPTIVQGRLTLSSGTPIPTSDVLAATSIFYTPYQGNAIALYDGTSWALYTFTEKSISIAGLNANTVMDIWGRPSGGTLAIDNTLWTNDTTRATALTFQDGILVKSGDPTRRYLGTVRSTGTVGQTEDSDANRYCWNYYNRVRRPLRKTDATTSWTYTTLTWRQANGAAANQVAVVIGVAEVPVTLDVSHVANNSGGNIFVGAAIGEDSTTVPSTRAVGSPSSTFVGSSFVGMHSHLTVYPSIGRHFYAWLETSQASGTTTWYGTNNFSTGGNQSLGLMGFVEG